MPTKSTLKLRNLKNPKSDVNNRLLLASEEGSIDKINASLQEGADILRAMDKYGFMAVDIAGDMGHKQAFNHLVTETAKARVVQRAKKRNATAVEIELLLRPYIDR